VYKRQLLVSIQIEWLKLQKTPRFQLFVLTVAHPVNKSKLLTKID